MCGWSALLVLLHPKIGEVLLVFVPRVLKQPELRLVHRLPDDPRRRNNAGQKERIVEDAEEPLVLAYPRTLHAEYLLLSRLFLHLGRVFLHLAEVELLPIGIFLLFLTLEDVRVIA